MPAGCRAHIAGQTGDALVVVDVWDDPELMDAFYSRELAPALAEVGITTGEPRILPVRNMIDQGTGRTSGTIMMSEAQGMTGDMYDAVVARMDVHLASGATPSVRVAPCRRRAVGRRDRDRRVGSPEEFGRFAAEQITRVSEGLLDAVEPRFVPVHNHQRAASAVAW